MNRELLFDIYLFDIYLFSICVYKNEQRSLLSLEVFVSLEKFVNRSNCHYKHKLYSQQEVEENALS
jgi:hypothetical protein